jgi:hypothetical protein
LEARSWAARLVARRRKMESVFMTHHINSGLVSTTSAFSGRFVGIV